MLQFRNVMAFVIICLAISNISVADEIHQQDWIGVRCAAYRGEHCRIPFATLFSQPYRVAQLGSKVRLRGYLVNDNGIYVLYADRSRAQIGWASDAIVVLASEDEAVVESLKGQNQSYVQIDGAVVLEASNSNEYWLAFRLNKAAKPAILRGPKLR